MLTLDEQIPPAGGAKLKITTYLYLYLTYLRFIPPLVKSPLLSTQKCSAPLIPRAFYLIIFSELSANIFIFDFSEAALRNYLRSSIISFVTRPLVSFCCKLLPVTRLLMKYKSNQPKFLSNAF